MVGNAQSAKLSTLLLLSLAQYVVLSLKRKLPYEARNFQSRIVLVEVVAEGLWAVAAALGVAMKAAAVIVVAAKKV